MMTQPKLFATLLIKIEPKAQTKIGKTEVAMTCCKQIEQEKHKILKHNWNQLIHNKQNALWIISLKIEFFIHLINQLLV